MGGLRQQLRRSQSRVRGQLERQLRRRGRIRPPHGHGQPQQRGLHDHAGQRVRRRQQAGLLGRRRQHRQPCAASRHHPLHARVAAHRARRLVGLPPPSRATSTATASATSRSARRARTSAPAPSTSSTAARPGSARRARSSGRRTRPGSPTTLRPATTSAGRWLSATSTATASTTSRSARRARTVGAGTVHVLYGSASGLTATGSQQWTQASTGVGDDPEPGDHFGATLAAGNLDTSTVASELVIGVPDEDIGAATDAGIVQVLRGTSTGLTGTGSQTWSQNSRGHRRQIPRPATASAPRSPSAISAARWPPTSRSACPRRTERRRSTTASSTSCSARPPG